MNTSTFFTRAEKITINKNDTYIKSYPSLITFFAKKKILTTDDVIIGMHMVYGWMPTVLTITENDTISIEEATEIFNKLKSFDTQVDGLVWDSYGIHQQLEKLKKKFNNSIVGVSKFLHFMRPDLYPIFDSNIYRYIFEEKPHFYRMNVQNYIYTIKEMEAIGFQKEATTVHNSIQNKIGYSITMTRAIELTIFSMGQE